MQIIVTIDGTQPKEAAKAGAFWLEYQKHCGKCGKCDSENTLFTHRKQQGFDFYEAACADCGARYSFGQKREDGSLFPKRDKGWEKFQKQEISGGYVGSSNTGGDSSDPPF